MKGRSQLLGFALHALATERAVPWHRVVNARGQISPRAEPGGDRIQRRLLEREGVTGTEGRLPGCTQCSSRMRSSVSPASGPWGA